MTKHVAGPDIDWKGFNIQRCALCGYALVKDDLTRMAGISESGNPVGPSVFPLGAIVEVEGSGCRRATVVGSIMEESGNPTPTHDIENVCIQEWRSE